MELTKDHFDKQVLMLLGRLDETATKSDLWEVRQVVDGHTATLDAISKNTEYWTTEAAALHSAISRHDAWLHQIADKLGMQLSDN